MCFVFVVVVLKARKVFVPGRMDFKQLSFTWQEAQYRFTRVQWNGTCAIGIEILGLS